MERGKQLKTKEQFSQQEKDEQNSVNNVKRSIVPVGGQKPNCPSYDFDRKDDLSIAEIRSIGNYMHLTDEAIMEMIATIKKYTTIIYHWQVNQKSGTFFRPKNHI